MAKHDLEGKVVVITGASSGFGKGAALELARARAHLVLAARRAELLTELAQQCADFGVETLAVPTDVGDRKQVEELCRSALGKFGRIDVWINNAGVGALGRFEAVPLDEHVKVIAGARPGRHRERARVPHHAYGSRYAVLRSRSQLHRQAGTGADSAA